MYLYSHCIALERYKFNRMEVVAETQNVIIVDNDLERIHQLNQVFEASRYNVIAHVGLEYGLLERVTQANPDIILIGVDSPCNKIRTYAIIYNYVILFYYDYIYTF